MGDVKQKIKKQKISFKGDLEPEVKTLIVNMLQVDPKRRPSVAQVLEYPFIKSLKQSMDDNFFAKNAFASANDFSDRLTRKKVMRPGVALSKPTDAKSTPPLGAALAALTASDGQKQIWFKKKKQNEVDFDFFSNDIPFGKYTKEKVLKGKYSYNLAGFGERQYNTSIEKKAKERPNFQAKFQKPAQTRELSLSSIRLPANFKQVTNLNQTVNVGTSHPSDPSLVQSSYDFQSSSGANSRKHTRTSNEELAAQTQKTQNIYQKAAAHKPLYKQYPQRQFSQQKLQYPKSFPSVENSAVLPMVNNLRVHTQGESVRKAGLRKGSFQNSESMKNLIFEDYRPFLQKPGTTDSLPLPVPVPGGALAPQFKAKGVIKKSKQDKMLQRQYTVGNSTAVDSKTVKNVFYKKNYPKASSGAQKNYRVHSKSMSINGNIQSVTAFGGALQTPIAGSRAERNLTRSFAGNRQGLCPGQEENDAAEPQHGAAAGAPAGEPQAAGPQGAREGRRGAQAKPLGEGPRQAAFQKGKAPGGAGGPEAVGDAQGAGLQ